MNTKKKRSGRNLTYHNKTVKERWQDWMDRHGNYAFRLFYQAMSVLICLGLVFTLLFMVSNLAAFGDPDNPTANEVPKKYIEEGVQDTGAINIVAGMILDYRAFDTFGESFVLFSALAAVMIVLRREGPPTHFDMLIKEMEEPQQSIVLKNTAFLLVSMIMMYGIYVILNGHLSPGGGFSGGAIVGASLILYASAYGTNRANRFYPFHNIRRVVSACLLFYALAKGLVFFVGGNHIPFEVPLGTPGNLLSSGLILPLNIAVGLIVASTAYVIYILFSKGELD